MACTQLTYGGWRLAGPGNSAEISAQRRQRGHEAVIAAYEAGYTLIDLADIYGDGACESIVGEVLRRIPEMRSRVLIATKCGIRKKGDPRPESPYRYDSSAEHITRSCESSLQRLGIETIDLYQLHRPDFLADPAEVAEAFGRLHQSGKVRAFGVSNMRPSQVTLLQEAFPFPLLTHQIEISLQHLDAFFDGTLDQCLTRKISPMAWSPLAGGRLAHDDPIDLHDPDHVRRLCLRETLDALARPRGVSRSVIALSWLMAHPAGIMPIVGSTDPVRIREATLADQHLLNREEWYRLLDAALGHRLP